MIPHRMRERWTRAGRMSLRKHGALLVFLVVAGAAQAQQATPAPAQAPVQDPAARESDPTKSVFLSFRSEYFNLRGPDNWAFAQIIRMDRAWLKRRRWPGSKVGVLTRFDLPIVASRRAGQTEAGLGDLYIQAAWVPWLRPNFALAMGSGLVFPSATNSILGRGKWQAAPVVAPIWFLPRKKGFFLVKMHQFVSFAGNRDRPDVNHLLVTPTLLYTLPRQSWMLVDTEIKTDWENSNRRSYRTGLEIGHVVKSRFALSVKPEFPWGQNREGDWNLKVIVTMYRPRK